MFDFSTIQYNSENPTLISILFTVICAFIFSSLIAFTYERTSRDVAQPTQYIQALVLISIVAAMVMQAIGDSLARGLGMLGALAIIRFRTSIRNPRNMVFMFASIATGIACGVFGFVIAFVGTVVFCLVAILLRFTPFSQATNMVGILQFELPQGGQSDLIQEQLHQYCSNHVLKNYTIITTGKKEGRIQYEYHIRLKDRENGTNFIAALNEIPKVKAVQLSFKDMNLEI